MYWTIISDLSVFTIVTPVPCLQGAARAMDTIIDFVQQEKGEVIEKFMISGASKVRSLNSYILQSLGITLNEQYLLKSVQLLTQLLR